MVPPATGSRMKSSTITVAARGRAGGGGRRGGGGQVEEPRPPPGYKHVGVRLELGAPVDAGGEPPPGLGADAGARGAPAGQTARIGERPPHLLGVGEDVDAVGVA